MNWRRLNGFALPPAEAFLATTAAARGFRAQLLLSIALMLPAIVHAQSQDPASDTLRTTLLNESIYQIDAVEGNGGGNVVVSTGVDGTLIVDSMTKAIAPKLAAQLAAISPKPVRYLVNTHFHLDHAGGNVSFGTAATIVAHDSVRKRLQAARMPAAGLPTVTYGDQLQLHVNGDDIRLLHCKNAHTDGDTVVLFSQSKVAHLGDLYFSGMFPAVYREGGGDWHGLIECMDWILPQLPEDTKVVAGHGPLSGMHELRAYVTMLKETTAIVEKRLARGESAQQMIDAKILEKYDKLGSGGAQTTDQFIGMLVKLLSPVGSS